MKIVFCISRLRVQIRTLTGAMSEKLRAFRRSPKPFDGAAEIWYDGPDALEILSLRSRSCAASRELREDEARFVDLSRSPIWIWEDRQIIQGLP